MIREHIYRCHQCPVFCQRCFESFENDEELTKHIRGEASCEVRERKVFDGITKEQQAALRSRKHLLFRGLSEEDQWRRIYRIIFPEAMDANTPSPCALTLKLSHDANANNRKFTIMTVSNQFLQKIAMHLQNYSNSRTTFGANSLIECVANCSADWTLSFKMRSRTCVTKSRRYSRICTWV